MYGVLLDEPCRTKKKLTHRTLTACCFEYSNHFFSIGTRVSHSILRERMLGRVADVFPSVLENLCRLLERFQVVEICQILVGVVAFVKPERHAEDDVERARIVRVATRVPIEWFLVVLTTARLCADRM